MDKVTSYNKVLNNYLNAQRFSSEELDKADDDIYQCIISAMVIWLLQQKLTEDEREAFIAASIKQFRRKILTGFNDLGDDMVQDLLRPHREDFAVQVNDHLGQIEDRLRKALL